MTAFTTCLESCFFSCSNKEFQLFNMSFIIVNSLRNDQKERLFCYLEGIYGMKLIMESWRCFLKEYAPIQDRPAISIYPEPGKLFDPASGQPTEHFYDLMKSIDDNKSLMMSEDDPYVDDWLQSVNKEAEEAIKSLKLTSPQMSEREAAKLREIEKAALEVQKIIRARNVTDPNVPTLQDFGPGQA